MGGYAYPVAGKADENTQETLREPLRQPVSKKQPTESGDEKINVSEKSVTESGDEKIFFAGEATWVEAGSTIQASFDSGKRAAKQILKGLS